MAVATAPHAPFPSLPWSRFEVWQERKRPFTLEALVAYSTPSTPARKVSLLLSHIEDAIVRLEKARNANPAPAYIHAYLAAAYALAGDSEEAAAELSKLADWVGRAPIRALLN